MRKSVSVIAVALAFTFAAFVGAPPVQADGVEVSVSGATATFTIAFWDIVGSQLFTGNVDNPAFFSGTMTVDGVVSGHQINGLPGDDSSFPFPNPVTQSLVPEPASLFLMGLGLLGIGALARKKTKAT